MSDAVCVYTVKLQGVWKVTVHLCWGKGPGCWPKRHAVFFDGGIKKLSFTLMVSNAVFHCNGLHCVTGTSNTGIPDAYHQD